MSSYEVKHESELVGEVAHPEVVNGPSVYRASDIDWVGLFEIDSCIGFFSYCPTGKNTCRPSDKRTSLQRRYKFPDEKL